MTRKFNVYYTCQHCGGRTTAETGFGRWMRNNPALDSGEGIVRTDCDHIICRYKTSLQGRDFQLMMIVEVKEFGASPDECQIDLLQFLAQSTMIKGKNRNGGITHTTHLLTSRKLGRKVRVRNFGVHLLQFEKTNPIDSKWIKWNRKLISSEVLVGLLQLERHPFHPEKMMVDFLRDRHKQESLLFDCNPSTPIKS